VAAYTENDGFHEIQLNGKQLVFLFMAATVVSVVIFLCGVLVGRGVRAERGDLAENAASSVPAMEVAPTPSTSTTQVVNPPPAGTEPAAQPPTPVDELSYFDRLEKTTPTPEKLRPAAEKEKVKEKPAAVAAAPAPPPAAVKPAPAPVPASAPAASNSEAERTAAQGWAVQVAALNVRSEADAMAKRLSSKGYSAYVVAPTSSTPAMFRVRIGTFKTRREAEAMAATLQTAEQFKPWVTR
jgi:cell division septation protein DedD